MRVCLFVPPLWSGTIGPVCPQYVPMSHCLLNEPLLFHRPDPLVFDAGHPHLAGERIDHTLVTLSFCFG